MQRRRSRRRWLSLPNLVLGLLLGVAVSTVVVLVGPPLGPHKDFHWPSIAEVAQIGVFTLVLGALFYLGWCWQGEPTYWICPRCHKVSPSRKPPQCSCREPLQEFWKWEWRGDE